MIAAALVAVSGCMHTGESAEVTEMTRSNAASATADANNISRETDPLARAAKCYVFLGASRNANSRGVGHDDVAMAQAQSQWYLTLRGSLSQIEADQLVGSSVNMLVPAEAAARDAASRYCVENAPTVDPTPGS